MTINSAEFIKGVVGDDSIMEDGLPQVAFIGRSNVGKSSIINSLVNRRQLVKTGKKPGKTMEINFFLINEEFYFVDLPGYGFAKADPNAKDRIRELILWYLMHPEVKPSLIVLIMDAKVGCTAFDQETLELLREYGHNYLLVANKIDKLNQKELTAKLAEIKHVAKEANVLSYSTVGDKRSEDLLGKIMEAL